MFSLMSSVWRALTDGYTHETSTSFKAVNISITPKSIPTSLCNYSFPPPTLTPGNHWSVFCHCRLSAFSKFYINGVMNSFLSDFSLSMIFWDPSALVRVSIIPSFSFLSSIPPYRYTATCIHSCDVGHLGCFQFSTLTNKAAINTYV